MNIRRCLSLLTMAAVCLAQDDDGPPKLKRGRPSSAKETTSTSQAPAQAPPAAVPDAKPRPASPPDEPRDDQPHLTRDSPPPRMAPPADPFLEKAREAAASFIDRLPNFLCQEMMTRYVSDTRPVSWRVVDTLSMDLVYEDHKEDYKNLKINGKPTNKTLQESGGAWSTGDFGTLMAAMFDEGTDADFRSSGSDRIEARDAIRYSVAVQQDRSGWQVSAQGERDAAVQTITVGYKGTVWLERETGRLLRLEIQADRIPTSFPMNAVEWAVNYSYTRISGEEYLLPTNSETLSCARGSRFCSRNVIDFRNYRKYGGDATITFEK